MIKLLRECPKDNNNKKLILLEHLTLWGTS